MAELSKSPIPIVLRRPRWDFADLKERWFFGGNGLTKEYPIEKIMRDARASMIEDGENNVLKLQGMNWLSEAFLCNNPA